MRFSTLLLLIVIAVSLEAWSGGSSGVAYTKRRSEYSNPPYSIHDWIADNARALLPSEERAWLEPFRSAYLLGTEAPEHADIPVACGAPNTGYGDRYGGGAQWSKDSTETLVTRAGMRAQQEYDNAVDAFADGDLAAAAFYLGAMAHYIGDVSQHGHAYPGEKQRAAYSRWIKRYTKDFTADAFGSYLKAGDLVRRRPYTAVQRIARATSEGQGDILAAEQMNPLFADKTQPWLDSLGASLNFAANEIAGVLHRFYLNEVSRAY
ncbi:MAG: zinc dependent phospholipase C family protein [Gemmatimonadota bacterium]|nr:MAG: zinc dependent phospholipase C family protein [Gemmatimonadota bacterium]